MGIEKPYLERKELGSFVLILETMDRFKFCKNANRIRIDALPTGNRTLDQLYWDFVLLQIFHLFAIAFFASFEFLDNEYDPS